MGKIKSNREFSARPPQVRSARAKRPTVSRQTTALGFPTISLDELVRRQGVKPLTDVNEFGSLWPDEFNPDEFLKWLSSERMTRRTVAADTTTEPD